jgi:hypothetical protein
MQQSPMNPIVGSVTTKIFVSITSGASKVIDDITPAYNTHLHAFNCLLIP